MSSAPSTTPLFSPTLISPDVAASLPENYTIRPLQHSDYRDGFLDVLRVLTQVGDVTQAKWDERYRWMSERSDEYFILVIWDGAKVVGAGTLVVERKFIHDLGVAGHIEDIAVAKDQQGKKLGLKIIQALDYVADKVGCYKVGSHLRQIEDSSADTRSQSILDCSEANEGFYVKCGFKRAGLEMAHYYDPKLSSKV
ncbi:MAG: hypothetical protein M4579_001318 [Chaenotheca gracillima]|nr:MAG: hypothetical protein M4579_001318 [Chaenotheca gracillima]